MAEYEKNKGLLQVDLDFLVDMVMTNRKNLKDAWRSIRR